MTVEPVRLAGIPVWWCRDPGGNFPSNHACRAAWWMNQARNTTAGNTLFMCTASPARYLGVVWRDHGILRDIFFGAQQLRAKILSNSGNKPKNSHRELRVRLFAKGKIKIIYWVCFTQCTLFSQKGSSLLPICLPCVICGSYVTKINAVLWHSARQTFASLGLFTFPRIACLLQLWIKTSELDYSFWATPK